MLRCASSFVIAAYETVRLIPQESRALPLALFTKPPPEDHFVNILKGDHDPVLVRVVMVNDLRRI
ncbi:MAG: hypothetical protein A2X92_09485 [Syntrophus sp. GWC2_56_31]|nr:MAG: hypothetical protein A2X92_09485 [Syntrophus sp. GWC2_56_31]